MNSDSVPSGRDSRPPWSGEVVPCPQCGKELPELAVACPYCGSHFEVTRSGYCPQCRAVAGATAAGTCEKCGGGMMDIKAERSPTADQAGQGAILPQAATSPAHVPPVSQPSAPPSSPEEPAISSSAVPSVTSPVASSRATGGPASRDAEEGLVGSGVMNRGIALLTMAPVGLIILWLLQWSAGGAWLSGLTSSLGDNVFVGTKGNEAYLLGMVNVVVALVTLIPLAGVTLLPRAGRELRTSGYSLMGLGVAVLLIAAWKSVVEAAVVALLVLIAGVVVLLLGSRSTRQAMKARPAATKLYRPRGLRTRLWIVLVLWLAGAFWYAVALARAGSGFTIQPGGYAAGGLIALGLIGAIVMLLGRRGQPSVWIDRGGQVVERPAQEPEPRTPAPALQVPIAAAKTETKAKAEAEAQGASPKRAIERKPRSRRLWVLLASAAGAAVAAAIVVAVLYGGGRDGTSDGDASATTAANAAPIRIGIALSFSGSGDAKNQCVLIKQGFDTERKYINANGGIMGRTVELVYEDDQSTHEGGMNVIQSLTDQGVDAIIGPFAGLTTTEARAIMEQAGILHIPLGPPSDIDWPVDQAKLTYWFQTVPDSEALADAWLTALVADGRENVVAIGDEMGTHQYALQTVQGLLLNAGIGCTLMEDSWELTDTDLTAVAKRIRAAVREEGADALIIASNRVQVNEMIMTLRSLGVTQPVYGSNAGADPLAMDASVGNDPADVAGNYAVGPATVNPAALPDDYPSKQELIDYIARWQSDNWGEVPAGIYLGLAYDTIHLAERVITIHLLDQANNATYPDALSPWCYPMWGIDWWGAQGHYVNTPGDCWGVHGGLFQWEYTDSGDFALVRALN